ncbi:hypothetical protein D9M71_676800 [compost metagenome]
MMPARCASGLHGTHIQPPDQAVAPPNTASFSTTMTFCPCQAAVTAVDKPAAPEPMTSTSHSTREDVGGWTAMAVSPRTMGFVIFWNLILYSMIRGRSWPRGRADKVGEDRTVICALPVAL